MQNKVPDLFNKFQQFIYELKKDEAQITYPSVYSA